MEVSGQLHAPAALPLDRMQLHEQSSLSKEEETERGSIWIGGVRKKIWSRKRQRKNHR